MTCEDGIHGWRWCAGAEMGKTKKRKPRRIRRPHADWILELGLMLLLVALLPGKGRRK